MSEYEILTSGPSRLQECIIVGRRIPHSPDENAGASTLRAHARVRSRWRSRPRPRRGRKRQPRPRPRSAVKIVRTMGDFASVANALAGSRWTRRGHAYRLDGDARAPRARRGEQASPLQSSSVTFDSSRSSGLTSKSSKSKSTQDGRRVNFDSNLSFPPWRSGDVQICRKICGLGFVTRALVHT